MHIKPTTSHRVFQRTLGGWIITLLLTLGMIVVFGSFAKVTSAAPPAAAPAQNALPTATPIPGIQQNPGSAPVDVQTASELDALLLKIEQTMQALQDMMGQIGRQNGLLPTPNPAVPTATPTVPPYTPTALPRANLPWVRSELQELEKLLVPLMKRIQADIQGSLSPQEIASLRAEVNLFQIRFAFLVDHLQKARGGSAVVTITAAATPSPMPDLPAVSPTVAPQADLQQTQAMLNNLNQLVQQMQSMLQQLQEQQIGANPVGASTGQVDGVNLITPTVPATVLPTITSTELPEPQNTPTVQMTPMPGLSGDDNSSADVSMDSLVATMESMTALIDRMTGNMSGQASGMNLPTSSPTPTPTALPGPSDSSSSTNEIMTMLDKLMQMIDDLVKMMNGGGGAGGTN